MLVGCAVTLFGGIGFAAIVVGALRSGVLNSESGHPVSAEEQPVQFWFWIAVCSLFSAYCFGSCAWLVMRWLEWL
ncbi:hypothetical protein Mal4_43910 [Maioricimonas rarisocia]|uniref:Uncharacterized protein n=1 Tax=Maioricimonas rarisocia TaxID=2528026 RepID=A0A517ZC44_9PLAN|nr:hypothetical protein [Maioricimonas rarisocia]QDU40037.1 hypothetical protein Mal4_43910 [Maioricimonas rarisocia]